LRLSTTGRFPTRIVNCEGVLKSFGAKAVFLPGREVVNDSPSPVIAPKRERLPSIDILRGFVMAVMALDHVRDYFSLDRGNWMDPTQTRVELFLTRWFAQLCAPAFFLLAGLGAYLSLSGGKSKATVARFLATRGLFLILLDLTLVRIAWDFNFDYEGGPWFIVLTCLGASMIVLAGLMFLSTFWVVVFSVAIIGGSNLLDRIPEAQWGRLEPLYTLLHSRSGDELFGIDFYVSYSLLPWVGIMSLGYAIGPIFRMEPPRRRRCLFLLGFGFLLVFAILRGLRLYGDPRPWSTDPDNPLTYLAFLRTKKYPASLQHVLMTLGPLLMALALLDRVKTPGMIGRWFVQFGRAPLFFYLLHLYVLHALVVLIGSVQGFPPQELFVLYSGLPDGFGFRLPGVFIIWLVVLAICFPLCKWFDRLKRRNQSVWLSYF